MKYKYIIILVIVGILAIIGFILSCINSYNSIRTDKIIGMWNDNNITYIETSDGNVWSMDKINNTKGYTLIFNTLGTDTIYDDVIIDIK